MVNCCISRNIELEELTLEEFRSFSQYIEEDVYGFIELEGCLSRRNTAGGPSSQQVSEAVKQGKKFLKDFVE
jgi:argininosuccinate lyase